MFRVVILIVALTFCIVFNNIPTAVQAQQFDITGIKLGMTWTEAKAVLDKRGVARIQTSYPNYLPADGSKFGYPNRFTITMRSPNEKYSISVYPQSTTLDIANPNNLIVHRVYREIDYIIEKAPSLSVTLTGLTQKYGSATDARNLGYVFFISWVAGETGLLNSDALIALPKNQIFGSRKPYECATTVGIYTEVERRPRDVGRTQVPGGYTGDVWSAAQSCNLVSAAIITPHLGSVKRIEQTLYDFNVFDTVAAAYHAADVYVKARNFEISNAAAPKTDF
jgi:hypothetical protein